MASAEGAFKPRTYLTEYGDFSADMLDARAALADRIACLCIELNLADNALHLAVALLDTWRSLCTSGSDNSLDSELVAMACLKLADAFDEHSQEYYQREKTAGYVKAAIKRWPAEHLLEVEKRIAQKLGFRLHRPTVWWFLRTCVSVAGSDLLEPLPGVVDLARFFSNLTALDWDIQATPTYLRSQVALLFAIYSTSVEKGLDMERTLSFWAPIRHATCGNNTEEAVSRCFMRMVHVLAFQRQKWSSQGLRSLDRRHRLSSQKALPASGFPDSLQQQLLPASCS